MNLRLNISSYLQGYIGLKKAKAYPHQTDDTTLLVFLFFSVYTVLKQHPHTFSE